LRRAAPGQALSGDGSYPTLKQAADKAISVLLIVLLAPVFLVVLAALALDMLIVPGDRGGWLYRERRISRGQQFDLLKFRALRQPVLAELAHRGGHARQAEANPHNLTWVGRHLLKPWYLDELPQLLNVLKGEMSLVGPRPWPPAMVSEQAAAGLTYRSLVQAGWTGPAQVTKGAPDSASHASLDLAYTEACRSWNSRKLLRHDLAILTKTLPVLLRGQGLRD
jgi:lipopolysaccharide/colanic/teichoic acid biosynthesis glycosyltransferase